MLNTLFVFLIFISTCGIKSSKPMQGELILNDCQKSWKILELKKPLIGKVIFHATASPACGILATGSVTIIQVYDEKMYRVIEYCNTDKNFEIGSTVVIKPETNANIPHIADDKLQCDLMETLFGVVEAKM